jgi:hypothetical protein
VRAPPSPFNPRELIEVMFVTVSLKKFDHTERKTFQECIRGAQLPFSDAEIDQAAAVHRCFRLDPQDRASARDLLEDP